MNYIGIDVAKDKHDCVILNQLDEVLHKPFTIQNNKDGFQKLLDITNYISSSKEVFQVAFEAKGHCHLNVLSFLLCNNFTFFVLNPLHPNLYRKSRTLRKRKTEKRIHFHYKSPDKILAFSGMLPTTYQSGQMYSTHQKMEIGITIFALCSL